MRLGAINGTVVAVVLGAILRLIDIGAQSYSMDELWEMSIIRLPAGQIVGAGDGFPPFFHLTFRAMFLGGLGDFSGRILSAICGVITIWVASRLARRIDPRLGTPAAFAVAIAPLLVLLSKEARAYGIFILLAGLLLLTTWDVIDSGTTRAWAGFIAVAAIGMYTHYMFALALASAELVMIWDMRRDGTKWTRWVFAHGVLAILLVPLVMIAIPDLELDAANDYSRTVDITAIAYAGLSLFTGMTLGPSTRALHVLETGAAIRSALPWLIVIGIPTGYLIYSGWKALSAQWRIRLAIPFVAPIVMLTILSAVVGTAFRVRYLAWLAIPLAIWLAAGWLNGSGKLRHVAVGVLIVVAATAMVTRDVVDDYRVEDARAAAVYVADHPDLPAVAMAWYMARPIEYYLGLDSATTLPDGNGAEQFLYHESLGDRVVPIPSVTGDDPTMSAQDGVFDTTVAPGQPYLLILSREFHADPDGAFIAERIAADGLKEVAAFSGITIYRGVRGS